MSERDPSADLRAAWSGLEPTPLDELADPRADLLGDHATAQLRAAWRGLEAPAPRVPRPRVAARPLLAFRVARWALAAGIAGLALYGAWRALASREHVKLRRADSDIVALVAPHADVRSIPLAALSRDSMELRSGNVRLLLFEPSAPHAPSTTTDTIPETPR
ncbi:MAG: hypothetical protein EPO68_18030 [Planctomycetota bacterium]|nr:MAG: hypothetical protein EPO68_18030 [Planctomycetota bacterium]